ncbi:MAG: hypothetical protein ACOX9C_06610 [Kiritimatiellia bacterium]|jgi:hypothetical protein
MHYADLPRQKIHVKAQHASEGKGAWVFQPVKAIADRNVRAPKHTALKRGQATASRDGASPPRFASSHLSLSPTKLREAEGNVAGLRPSLIAQHSPSTHPAGEGGFSVINDGRRPGKTAFPSRRFVGRKKRPPTPIQPRNLQFVIQFTTHHSSFQAATCAALPQVDKARAKALDKATKLPFGTGD